MGNLLKAILASFVMIFASTQISFSSDFTDDQNRVVARMTIATDTTHHVTSCLSDEALRQYYRTRPYDLFSGAIQEVGFVTVPLLERLVGLDISLVASFDEPFGIRYMYPRRTTPAHIFAEKNNHDALRWILESDRVSADHAVDVDVHSGALSQNTGSYEIVASRQAQTLFHAAYDSRTPNIETLRILLDNGADPLATGARGIGLVTTICGKIMDLNYGATDATIRANNNIIHELFEIPQIRENASELLAQSFGVNGETPFLYVCRCLNVELAQILEAAGADVYARYSESARQFGYGNCNALDRARMSYENRINDTSEYAAPREVTEAKYNPLREFLEGQGLTFTDIASFD